ncbi:YciI-like protein [Motiliproteus sediminis]|uniref:YciI-like protein n=1 Tax=Motiliproteus sediminis TaxID=1468178 RepID=UPI001AEFB835|nr:YciI-like protein [Motiliproteus sediminis]
MHFILFYDYAPDYLERRGEFRDAHLAWAKASIDRGEFWLGGAFANPADGAAIIFNADSAAVVEDFAQGDPYVINGLVTGWRVREWTTVAGKAACNPLVS